ncbi:MAG TPA: hypothetical protein VFS00_21580 [Polyangiaceae bacterium]|nr:hypothetical protein [Polyangiaceae bacterium]
MCRVAGGVARVGYVNRDGSINLSLDALPLGSSKLQLRDYSLRDAEAGEPPEGYQPDAARAKLRRAPEDRS